MKHYFGDAIIIHGECREAMFEMSSNSLDSCVTDPPYHLTSIGKRPSKKSKSNMANNKDGSRHTPFHRHSSGFMGQVWDGGDIAFRPALWRDVYRVLKPGAYLLAFAATRNYHRMACAIEDAGFEIRDCIQWIYGSGFPKSQNVSRTIDTALGVKGSISGAKSAISQRNIDSGKHGSKNMHEGWRRPWMDDPEAVTRNASQYIPASKEAQKYNGFGTALKPACELIVMARKPLSEKTIAANILRWGTGALNIDDCRIEFSGKKDIEKAASSAAGFAKSRARGTIKKSNSIGKESRDGANTYNPAALKGRWPANVIHDGSDEVVNAFPKNDIVRPARAGTSPWTGNVIFNNSKNNKDYIKTWPSDTGGSSARFFFTAKASQRERQGSDHPTVKPLNLLRHLIRMVTPPGGKVLDPFAGTGTTGEAAMFERCRPVLIEQNRKSVVDIIKRMKRAKREWGFFWSTGKHNAADIQPGSDRKLRVNPKTTNHRPAQART